MSILIGNARGGDPTYTPGDQSGAEVRTQAWYLHSSGWNFVARFKNRAKAAKAAKFCRAACVNPHIGYGQGDRSTLRPLAKEAGWDASKITQDCNCDCTSFVSVCAEAGGVNMDSAYTYGNAPYSENIRQKLAATGEFEILTDQKYLTSDQYLMCGDIVVNEPAATGHAVMALEDGPLAGIAMAAQAVSAPAVATTSTAPAGSIKEIKATGAAYYFDKSLAGTYECTAKSFLSVFDGPSTRTKELTRLKPGETVDFWGYYSVGEGAKWLYITFVQGDTRYTGFACSLYLRKKAA